MNEREQDQRDSTTRWNMVGKMIARIPTEEYERLRREIIRDLAL